MASDNVELLSYTSPINAGVTVTTEKVILGQYISLSIISKSDQDMSILVQYSGDGTNWDYSVTNSVAAGANSNISATVVGKWVRLQITNSSAVNATYNRVYVYATPTNSVITANISKIGNIWPSVEIGTSVSRDGYNAIDVSSPNTLVRYNFTQGTNFVVGVGSVNTSTPYDDLYIDYRVGSAVTANFLTSGLLYFSNIVSAANDFILMVGRQTCQFRPMTSLTCVFYASYTQALKTVGNPKAATELIGMGTTTDFSAASIRDFVGYGYTNSRDYNDPDAFGIIIYRNGVRTYISRGSWNVDTCDGTNVMPALDFTKLNCYKVSMGIGAIRFYVCDPNTNIFQLVHVASISNSASNSMFLESSFGLINYITHEANSSSVTSTDTTNLSYFTIFSSEPYIYDKRSITSSEISGTGITAETLLGSYTTYKWQSSGYNVCGRLNSIRWGCVGSAPIYIRIYRNCNLTAAADVALTTRSAVSQIAVPALVAVGELLHSIVVKIEITTASSAVNGFYEFEEGILIYPQQNLDYDLANITITAQSSSSASVYLSLGFSNR